MFHDSYLQFLCNYDDKLKEEENPILQKLWSANYAVNENHILKKILSTDLQHDSITKIIKNVIENDYNLVLDLSISLLLTFCEYNWNPHPEKIDLEIYLGRPWPANIDVLKELQVDSEPIYVNILYPELLYLAIQIFNVLYKTESSLINTMWYFRTKVIHQRALDDSSATLYSELEFLMAKLTNELLGLKDKPRLQVLLCLELGQANLMYGRIQKVEEYLLKARDLAGLKLRLTGILGKRTKFQQNALPQLALSSELDESVPRLSAEESHGSSELPPEVELQDDVRLNKIQYDEKITQTELPSLEQTLCLLMVQYILKSQPKDDLTNEELQPYIEAILTQKKGPWSTRVAALLIRCKLEASHKRTVERAMLQCETIVNEKCVTSATNRLSYLWATGLPPSWTWRQQLADLYLSLGLVKAALDEYLQLSLWEDVIVCYTVLQLRHKAAEVIRQQIEINPTVKLYCLLGDATDDVSWYEKAWEFSNQKSGRAQRHWGNYLFEHKKYEECIPHFEKSVEINSIQESVWLNLGYAALVTEKWELAAKAYRRYTYLQPNTFEAWNNLAKVYVKQGDKNRAYRSLIEALRFNYDNWKLWENVIAVSIDTGHFEDVIRGGHRLLDLRRQFDDVEVLRLLAKAIIDDVEDASGNNSGRLRKRVLELFGRITSVHPNKPELWQIYSDLSPTNLLRAQRLLKAYRGYAQTNWSSSPETCKQLMDIAQGLLEYSKQARQECEEKDIQQATQQLSSARLTAQSIISAIDKQNWPETQEALASLKELLSNVTDYMKSIMYIFVSFYIL